MVHHRQKSALHDSRPPPRPTWQMGGPQESPIAPPHVDLGERYIAAASARAEPSCQEGTARTPLQERPPTPSMPARMPTQSSNRGAFARYADVTPVRTTDMRLQQVVGIRRRSAESL